MQQTIKLVIEPALVSFWPLRLSVRTPDFQSGKTGSTPVGAATFYLFDHFSFNIFNLAVIEKSARFGYSGFMKKFTQIIRSFVIATFASVFLLGFVPTAFAQYANTESGPQTGLPKSTLSIKTASGVRTFRVELADTYASREIGMMWRTSLGRTEGMLFNHPDVAPRAFWMKNTLIPLDIIYIGANGRIVRIARNAQPLTLTPIPSGVPAKAVLEIGGGEAVRQGIREGDVVTHSIFSNTSAASSKKSGSKTKNR